ncbi:hypothetical protein [Streptomyces sp. NPDC001222]|uniref:hypothetical protein n=1 Tax=Streptomyces sp. NPDC001222 TaxID=3364548 RepID=UPI00369B35E2
MSHLGVGMESRWAAMECEKVTFDEPTKRLLTEQAKDFGGIVDELAAERDRKQITVTRSLAETFDA